MQSAKTPLRLALYPKNNETMTIFIFFVRFANRLKILGGNAVQNFASSKQNVFETSRSLPDRCQSLRAGCISDWGRKGGLIGEGRKRIMRGNEKRWNRWGNEHVSGCSLPEASCVISNGLWRSSTRVTVHITRLRILPAYYNVRLSIAASNYQYFNNDGLGTFTGFPKVNERQPLRLRCCRLFFSSFFSFIL